jgi:hypothetical protein
MAAQTSAPQRGRIRHGFTVRLAAPACTSAVTRHFPTRLDLIAAAAQEVALRQEGLCTSGLSAAPKGSSPVRTAIRLLRAGTRTPLNAVWLELAVAARTTPELAAGSAR